MAPEPKERQRCMMWVLYAFGSALFAGLTSVLAKCGIKKTDSNVAVGLCLVMTGTLLMLAG